LATRHRHEPQVQETKKRVAVPHRHRHQGKFCRQFLRHVTANAYCVKRNGMRLDVTTLPLRRTADASAADRRTRTVTRTRCRDDLTSIPNARRHSSMLQTGGCIAQDVRQQQMTYTGRVSARLSVQITQLQRAERVHRPSVKRRTKNAQNR
jgi:hypothetical protein